MRVTTKLQQLESVGNALSNPKCGERGQGLDRKSGHARIKCTDTGARAKENKNCLRRPRTKHPAQTGTEKISRPLRLDQFLQELLLPLRCAAGRNCTKRSGESEVKTKIREP